MEPEKDSASSSQKPSLSLGLLGTLVVVSAFFVSFWSKFKTPINESTNPPRDHNSTSDYRQPRYEEKSRGLGTTKMNQPQTAAQNCQAQKKSKHWLKKWKLWALVVNVVTFIAVAWYACEAHKANIIAHNYLVASQRPWVGITDVVFSPPKFSAFNAQSEVQMELNISYFLKNSGLSPAYRVNVEVEMVPYNKYGYPPPIFIPYKLPAKDMKRDIGKNEVTFFLLPNVPIHQTYSVATSPERGKLFKDMSNIWIAISITYEDSLQGGVHGTNYIYHGMSLDAAPYNIAVPGHGFTYKSITMWNGQSSEAN